MTGSESSGKLNDRLNAGTLNVNVWVIDMTRDDIIRMAREQGLPETATEGVFRVNVDDLGRLLAAEREVCAELMERQHAWITNVAPSAIIRARSTT